MMSADDMLADQAAADCERDHDAWHASCQHCAVRDTWQHCFNCPAEWEDGQQVVPGHPDHDHVLMDDWDNEVLCKTQIGHHASITGLEAGPCGASVTTPGKTRCTFHQRFADSIEAGRIYQRLVATR